MITKIKEFEQRMDEATSSAEVTAATEGVVEAAAEATAKAAAMKDPDAAKATVEAANDANDVASFARVLALLMEFNERTDQAKASAEVTATSAKVTVAAKRPRDEDPERFRSPSPLMLKMPFMQERGQSGSRSPQAQSYDRWERDTPSEDT